MKNYVPCPWSDNLANSTAISFVLLIGILITVIVILVLFYHRIPKEWLYWVLIPMIVVIGGIGSVSGSVIATFLYVACSEWWLRFLDSEQYIGGFKVPLLRNGFRMVVFSVIIMIIVLFFSQGIMGTKELPDLFKEKKASGDASKEVAG